MLFAWIVCQNFHVVDNGRYVRASYAYCKQDVILTIDNAIMVKTACPDEKRPDPCAFSNEYNDYSRFALMEAIQIENETELYLNMQKKN